MACGTLAVAGGAVIIGAGLRTSPGPPSLPAPTPATGYVPVPVVRTASPAARTVPARVIIPAIGIDAAVVPEGTDSSGRLAMPSLSAQNITAWWDGGAAPGQAGPAVIAGHVDNTSGPLVFWNLRLLKPGDAVETEPGNLRFTVSRITQVDKGTFPTGQVYGPTADPELRLITCGGAFDTSSGHYLDNVIIYAQETGD
ncbi:MAG TPA: sortase [Trebonia sp.]